MRDVLLVALGGALGSVLRWLASTRVPWPLSRDLAFPWATLAVNLVGSLLIGFLLGLTLERQPIGVPARLFLVTGLLGGFTTFSAFSWEAIELVRTGQPWVAAGYSTASVAGGLLAAWLGIAAASFASGVLAART